MNSLTHSLLCTSVIALGSLLSNCALLKDNYRSCFANDDRMRGAVAFNGVMGAFDGAASTRTQRRGGREANAIMRPLVESGPVGSQVAAFGGTIISTEIGCWFKEHGAGDDAYLIPGTIGVFRGTAGADNMGWIDPF